MVDQQDTSISQPPSTMRLSTESMRLLPPDALLSASCVLMPVPAHNTRQAASSCTALAADSVSTSMDTYTGVGAVAVAVAVAVAGAVLSSDALIALLPVPVVRAVPLWCAITGKEA
jgi:hypothetical protein